MKYQYIAPALPSFARWRNLHARFPGNSLLRQLEYEALQSQDIDGRILDIGGGDNARYRAILPDNITYESVNIDPEIKPTWLIAPQEPFPIEAGIFDWVTCFNTLEHIFDPLPTLKEAFRVLKPGGTIVISVPWIFRIHGHPDDYNRSTPSWWKESLESVGFQSMSLLPLVWGRNSTALTVSGSGMLPRRFGAYWAHLKDTLYAKMRFKSGHYDGRRGNSICGVSVGWFIVARK